MSAPVSRFPVVPTWDLPEELRERYAAVEERSGFLPNVFRRAGLAPRGGGRVLRLPRCAHGRGDARAVEGRRELIVVATGAANDCLYCVVAHGAIARIRTGDPYLADQWKDLRPPGARKLAPGPCRRPEERGRRAGRGDRRRLDRLREQGLTEDDVRDVGANVGLFAPSDRLAHWAAIPPNEEFFLMGRLQKA